METLVKNTTEILIENSIEIDYSTSIHCECDGNVKEIEIKIYQREYDHTSYEDIRKEIGSGKIQIVRNLLDLDYYDIFEYCDIISSDLLDAFISLFNDNNSKNKTKFNTIDFNRFIYIELFKISDEKRNLGIGNAVINDIIDTLGLDDTLFIVLPYAIEDKKNKITHTRVKKFWSGVGFKKYNNTKFYHLVGY